MYVLLLGWTAGVIFFSTQGEKEFSPLLPPVGGRLEGRGGSICQRLLSPFFPPFSLSLHDKAVISH